MRIFLKSSHLQSVEKLSSMKLVPGAKKVGNRCSKLLQLDSLSARDTDSIPPAQATHWDIFLSKFTRQVGTGIVVRDSFLVKCPKQASPETGSKSVVAGAGGRDGK